MKRSEIASLKSTNDWRKDPDYLTKACYENIFNESVLMHIYIPGILKNVFSRVYIITPMETFPKDDDFLINCKVIILSSIFKGYNLYV